LFSQEFSLKVKAENRAEPGVKLATKKLNQSAIIPSLPIEGNPEPGGKAPPLGREALLCRDTSRKEGTRKRKFAEKTFTKRRLPLLPKRKGKACWETGKSNRINERPSANYEEKGKRTRKEKEGTRISKGKKGEILRGNQEKWSCGSRLRRSTGSRGGSGGFIGKKGNRKVDWRIRKELDGSSSRRSSGKRRHGGGKCRIQRTKASEDCTE